MRLHSARVPHMAKAMVDILVSSGDVETDNPRGVQADFEAVITQYIRDDHSVTEKARDMVAARSLPMSDLGRIKRLVAEQQGFVTGEEAMAYLLNQLIEMLMRSPNVEEVYAEDADLRRKLRGPIRKELEAEDSLDSQVRGQLKHVREGTAVWDVEYRRMLEEIKHRRGMD